MPPVISVSGSTPTPPGYRRLGKQAVRIDIAEKLLRAAHEVRVGSPRKPFVLDPALAISTGLTTTSYAWLLRLGGFRASVPRPLKPGALGPLQPPRWRWQPPRREAVAPVPVLVARRPGNAFAALADLVR